MREQCRALRNGVDVVVATCGRLCHLVDDGVVSLADVTYLCLDEADRMLDDGFEPQIRKIMGECAPTPKRLGEPGGRRTVMFSATWPQEVRKLAGEFLRKGGECMRVNIGSDDLSANKRVTQVVEVMDGPHGKRRKEDRLFELLDEFHHKQNSGGKLNRMIVFVLYKKEAVRVGNETGTKGRRDGKQTTRQQLTLART